MWQKPFLTFQQNRFSIFPRHPQNHPLLNSLANFNAKHLLRICVFNFLINSLSGNRGGGVSHTFYGYMHFKLKFSNLRFTCNSNNNNNKTRSSNKSFLQNCRMQINLSCRPAQTIYACCQHCLSVSFSLGHNCPCTLPPSIPGMSVLCCPVLCGIFFSYISCLPCFITVFRRSVSSSSDRQRQGERETEKCVGGERR